MQNESDPLAPPADVPKTPPSASPVPGVAAAMPGQQPVPTTPGAQPGTLQAGAPLPGANKNLSKIILIIVAVVFGITASTFVGLFIWKNEQYKDASTDVNSQIDKAVSNATMELETKKEREFNERQNYPYSTFSAKEDYGEFSFEYPKTWSVYVAKDAKENKGDYEAYLNPEKVEPVSATRVNAVRVIIKSQTFEKTITEYDKLVEKGLMSMEVRTLDNQAYPNVVGETYNLYRGELPSKLRGAVAIFRVRDKVCILQTDAEQYLDEASSQHIGFLDPVLNTVHYNK